MAKIGSSLSSDEETDDPNEIYSLSWSPDGKTLAAGGGFSVSSNGQENEGSSLRVWDGANGKLLNTVTGYEKGFYGYSGVCSVNLKKSAREADDYKSIEIWDLTSGRLLKTING